MIWVRRSSPYLSTISGRFVGDDLRRRDTFARMSPRSAISSSIFSEVVDDLLALERGQPAQLHVEDRVGLDLVDLEGSISPAGVVDLGRPADQRDHPSSWSSALTRPRRMWARFGRAAGTPCAGG